MKHWDTGHFIKRKQPISSLARHRRRTEARRVKNWIEKEKEYFGGKFVSYDALFNYSSEIESCEIFFLVKDKFTYWWASISTAKVALDDAVNKIENEETSPLITPEESRAIINACIEADFEEHEAPPVKAFNGLTYSEFSKKKYLEILEEMTPIIHESYQLTRIGECPNLMMKIIIDKETFNRHDIESIIEKLLSEGEREWKSEQPIDTKALVIALADEKRRFP